MIVLRLARAALLASAGTAVTLSQLNLPSRGFWDHRSSILWIAVLILAWFVMYDATKSVFRVVRSAQIVEYDHDLRVILGAFIRQVVAITGAPWDEVAVCYYLHRRWWRRGTVSHISSMSMSGDGWDCDRTVHRDVGLVGVAMAEEAIIVEEWSHFVQEATYAGQKAWAERSKRARYGLTWGQLRRAGMAQPQAQMASPTFSAKGKIDGCLLLSGTIKIPALMDNKVRRELDNVATTLYRLGRPPAGWWTAHER